MLLILAGVSIGTLFGEHGIIKKAQETVDKTKEEVEKEQREFENLLEQLNSLGNTEDGEEKPTVKDTTGPTLSEIETIVSAGLTIKFKATATGNESGLKEVTPLHYTISPTTSGDFGDW